MKQESDYKFPFRLEGIPQGNKQPRHNARLMLSMEEDVVKLLVTDRNQSADKEAEERVIESLSIFDFSMALASLLTQLKLSRENEGSVRVIRENRTEFAFESTRQGLLIGALGEEQYKFGMLHQAEYIFKVTLPIWHTENIYQTIALLELTVHQLRSYLKH